MLPDVPERVTLVPAVNVTSVPVSEVKVKGELVPETARFVEPVLVEAMVTTPSNPVPEVVKVIPAPSANCRLPPEAERVAV